MTIGHWTGLALAAALVTGCNARGNDTGTTSDAGTTSGATSADTTLTGGQGGMADTSIGGMSDTTHLGDTSRVGGSDTSRP